MKMTVPESVGMSSDRLERIGPALQRYVDDGKFAGMLAVVACHGKIAYLREFGMMDVETQEPMRADAIFRIYSMSKPITSVALMMLYEQGGFQLNDPVASYIPAFAQTKVFVRETSDGMEVADQERPITVRHLLTHTSGLAYGIGDGAPVESLYAENDMLRKDEPLSAKIPRLATLPLAQQPGTMWRYSMATDVLGYLVEILSDLPLDRYLQERIFGPLGMVDTGFYAPAESLGRLATLYNPTEDGGIERVVAAEYAYDRPRAFLSGGGGLVSTAHDYMRFAQTLLNRGELDGIRLLGRKTVEMMTRNHLSHDLLPFGGYQGTPRHGMGFGLGFQVTMDVAQSALLGSKGLYRWGGAAATDFWVDPREGLIGLLLPQLMRSPHLLSRDFRVLVYQALVD